MVLLLRHEIRSCGLVLALLPCSSYELLVTNHCRALCLSFPLCKISILQAGRSHRLAQKSGSENKQQCDVQKFSI